MISDVSFNCDSVVHPEPATITAELARLLQVTACGSKSLPMPYEPHLFVALVYNDENNKKI